MSTFWLYYIGYFLLCVIAIKLTIWQIRTPWGVAHKHESAYFWSLCSVVFLMVMTPLTIISACSPEVNLTTPIIAGPTGEIIPCTENNILSPVDFEYAYRIDDQLIINPGAPSHYDERFVNLFTNLEFFFEGNSNLPYYAYVKIIAKPYSVDTARRFSLKPFKREDLQWKPLDRLADDIKYRETRMYNYTQIQAQEKFIKARVEEAIVQYLQNAPNPNADEAIKSVEEMLKSNWYVAPGLTITPKTNNW